MQAISEVKNGYVCKLGEADEKRLDAQAKLTSVPLNEALIKWTKRLDQSAILRL